MLSCKLNRKTSFDLPTLVDNTYHWKDGCYLSVLNNPHITSKLFFSTERWICLITIGPPANEKDSPSSLETLRLCDTKDIYRAFSELESEGIMIELTNNENGSLLRIIATNEGSIPIYFCQNNNIVHLNWNFKEITSARHSLILDFEYLIKSTFEPIYSNRTAFQGISMLTAGSSCIFSDEPCEYKYPPAEPQHFPIIEQMHPEAAIEGFSALLKEKISRQLAENKKVAVELSGGLDSSTVSATCALALPDAKISTYGIIVSDPTLVLSQKSRRAQVINFINGDDFNIDIQDYLPSLTSQAPDKFYLNAEAYGDAFESIWSQAVNDGHHAILNGCGGDELFPQFMNEDFSSDHLRSIDHNSWNLYNNLLSNRLSSKATCVLGSYLLPCAPKKTADTGMLLAMARRAPLLMNHNLIPLYPLRDDGIIKFCSQLPIHLRLNKSILSFLLNKNLNDDAFSNYPKETFMHADKTALLKNKEHYLKACLKFKILDIGLIDSKTLTRDLSSINAGTPRYFLDYLLNILAIERFLESYL